MIKVNLISITAFHECDSFHMQFPSKTVFLALVLEANQLCRNVVYFKPIKSLLLCLMWSDGEEDYFDCRCGFGLRMRLRLLGL